MAARTVTIEVKMDISNAEGKITQLTGSMKLLGDEVKKTGKSTDDFERLVTKNMKEGETAFTSLTRRSKELTDEVGRLKQGFAGSTSGGQAKSILGDLTGAQNDLKKVKNFLKDMEEEGAQAGHNFGEGFSKNFILSFRTIPEFLASPVGGSLVAVLAPALIAGVAGAVTAGIGLGIVGAGAFILHNDPRIQAVFAPLKDDLVSTFTSAAEPLVTPIIGALGSLDLWIKNEKPALTSLFASVAPSVGLIGQGVQGFIGDLIPALTKVGQTFTQVFKDPEVEASLKGVSQGFANIFRTIGDNPKEVADGILFLNGVLKGTFGLLTDIFNIAGPVVADLRQLRSVNSDQITGGFDPGLQPGQGTKSNPLTQKQFNAAGGKGDVASGGFVRVSDAAVKAAQATGNFADSQKQAAEMVAAAAAAARNAVPDYKALSSTLSATSLNADTLAGQLTDKVLNGMLGVDNAANNFQKSLITVDDAIVANGGHLSDHVKALKKTETGQQQETDAVLQAIQANLQVYDSQIAVGVSAYDAAQAYDANAKSLDNQVKSAGHVPPAIQKLIDKYAKVPDDVNTQITTQGLTDAINNLDTTLRLINHLDGLHAYATVTTTFITKGDKFTLPRGRAISRWGNIYQPAAEGVLSGPKIYEPANPGRFMIAESATGGEAFIPRHGSYGRSMDILSAAAGWYGAHVVPGYGGSNGGGGIQVMIYASDPQSKALLAGMRYVVQSNGGDVVKVLTPR